MAGVNKLEEVKSNREKWEQGPLDKALSRFGERQKTFTSISGTSINRLYTPEDISEGNYLTDLGFPGDYPYTRGVQPTM